MTKGTLKQKGSKYAMIPCRKTWGPFLRSREERLHSAKDIDLESSSETLLRVDAICPPFNVKGIDISFSVNRHESWYFPSIYQII